MSIKCILGVLILLCDLIVFSSSFKTTLYLYEIFAFSDRDRSLLYAAYVQSQDVAFLNGVTNEAALPIMVTAKPADSELFEQFLVNNSIQFTRITINRDFMASHNNADFTKTFHEWPVVTEWISKFVNRYSSIVKKIVIGQTFQHRELFVLKVSKESRVSKHFNVFILSGEEGRDWLTPAVSILMMAQLVQGHKLFEGITDYFDFYFMPFFNPDGYQYSIVSDIMWAKNRKDFTPYKTCGDDCLIGVNVDRNWLMRSDVACTPVNLGLDPMSEQETSSLGAFVSTIAPRTIAFINIRAFMRLVAIPSGNNYDILVEIIDNALAELNEKHNIAYQYGNKDRLLYNFSSSAADWMKQKLNIPVVLTTYMQYGENYFPKETDIEPLARELTLFTRNIIEIAKEIYAPVINKQIRFKICLYTFAMHIFLLMF